jgi:Protein of unknown function (DUF541)
MNPHFLRLDRSRRMAAALVLALSAAIAGALLAAGSGTTATAQAPSGTKTVTAVGIGQVNVTPKDRHNNASIVEAVEASEAKAIPQAVSAARERATGLAKAGGLTLGAVQSVEETQQQFPFYGPGGPNAYPAPFGKDKYCGNERRPRFVRDANGRRRVSGSRLVHVCRVPRFVTINLSVTFAAT